MPQTASLALVPPPTAAPAPAIGPGRADGARTTTGHLESTAVLPLPKAPYVARPSLRRRSKLLRARRARSTQGQRVVVAGGANMLFSGAALAVGMLLLGQAA